ncbi:MAG: hypothetical protein ACM3MB_09920 [Acidobacteriota bacterium]
MDFHKRHVILESIRNQVEQALLASGREMAGLRELAKEAADEIEALSPFIEQHTSAVCPDCERVCCLNRHSYPELDDIVYLYSLGERPPVYGQDILDTEPCQFLGELGCRLRRSLRPHRCNWFFCAPLLDRIQSLPARDYRAFIAGLQEINRRRERLITAFGVIMRKGPCDPGHLKVVSDEIFFT